MAKPAVSTAVKGKHDVFDADGNFTIDVPDDDAYQPQYGVVTVVEDESAQRELYEKLKDMGYNPRVATI